MLSIKHHFGDVNLRKVWFNPYSIRYFDSSFGIIFLLFFLLNFFLNDKIYINSLQRGSVADQMGSVGLNPLYLIIHAFEMGHTGVIPIFILSLEPPSKNGWIRPREFYVYSESLAKFQVNI